MSNKELPVKNAFNRFYPFLLIAISMLSAAVLMALAGAVIFTNNNDKNNLPDDGIIRSVVKAPVAPDGNMAGQTTDMVLNLDVSMDPNEPGFSLQESDQIRVRLSEAFEKGKNLPLLNIIACLAENLQCDTVVPLLGWPQGALGAPSGASGQEVFTEAPSGSVNAPVTGIPAGHLRAFFKAGSATGEYVVTIELDGGNSAEMVARVQSDISI